MKKELFKRESAYKKAPEVNYEGAPAFVRSKEERLIQVLTTGTFENTFYAEAKELASEAVELMQKFLDRPDFLGKAAVWARTKGLMRIAPITALIVLSTAEDKMPFYQAFPKIIQTPGDLQDFVSLVRTGHFRGMGRSVKSAIQSWLLNMSPYHAIKYGSEAQAFSLRDILRLARPRPTSPERKAMFSWLVKGEISDDLSETIQGYEAFKKAQDDQERLRLMEGYNLPYELVTAHISSPEAWLILAREAPFMNMLRNLNNYQKYDVFENEYVRNRVVARLTDPETIAKSKQFPFRFFAAHKAFEGHFEIEQALFKAIELSFDNLPQLPGQVLIGVDESGSMDNPISPRSTMRCLDIANIFAAALFKKSQALIYAFSDEAERVKAYQGDSIFSIAKQIEKTLEHGGTNLSAPLELLLKERTKVNVGIFISDNESWIEAMEAKRSWSSYHQGIMDYINDYRRLVNRNFKAFFVQLLPYRHSTVEQDYPSCWFLYGWSDSVIRFIAQILLGGKDQIDEILAS